MYYNYDEGPAKYETPDGEVEGDITLKRQYNIQNGELKYYIDTKQTINDEILQQVLSQHASAKMKQIVSTIQKEQNEIIREEKFRTILVQGVAGSGKTSIALHRAGYLLYNHRDILSPSNLFSSYVSEVLPELGEENVIEMTFSHIAKTELKKVIEPREKLMDEIYKSKNQKKLNEIAYKASFSYLEDLLKFLKDVYAGLFDPKDMLFKPADAKEDTYNAFYFPKEELKKLYPNEKMIGFFYNPNIHPKEEHDLRLFDVKRSCDSLGVDLIVGDYNLESWLDRVKGFEDAEEKGDRCTICFDERLLKSAALAMQLNEKYLTTTLLTSPMKSQNDLFNQGESIAKEYGLEFVSLDIRSNGGTQRQSKMAKDSNLYRQNYCGCEFSIR